MAKRVRLGLIASVVALGMVIGGAAPAFALTKNGYIDCSGTGYPRLTLDVYTAGSGTWVNANNAGQSQGFNFPGGHSTKNGPYQDVYWAVTSTGFYSEPSGTCIQG